MIKMEPKTLFTILTIFSSLTFASHLALATTGSGSGSGSDEGHEHHGANCPKLATASESSVAPRQKRQANPFESLGGLLGNAQQNQGPPKSFDQTLPQAINEAAAPGGNLGAGQLMSSLNGLLRSSQETSSKALENGKQGIQTAQTGISAALTEVGQGLRRIVDKNPNLVPDVKQLYSSVSSKLTGSASPLASAQAAAGGPNAQQLTGQLQKSANLSQLTGQLPSASASASTGAFADQLNSGFGKVFAGAQV